MMYCLRTFLPLLLLPLPLSLSPIHLATLLVLTYVLNRPCPYCSLLLIILFANSCHWSGKCFWGSPVGGGDTYSIPGGASSSSPWNATESGWEWEWLPYFIPRLYTTPTADTNATDNSSMTAFLLDLTNSTISTFASSAIASAAGTGSSLLSKAVGYVPSTASLPNSSVAAGGVGTQWLKTLLGRGEWTLPCVNVKVVI